MIMMDDELTILIAVVRYMTLSSYLTNWAAARNDNGQPNAAPMTTGTPYHLK